MRAVITVIRRGLAAWRGRCRCRHDDGGSYGLNARWVAGSCPRHGPGTRVAPDWPAVATLGCTCPWRGVPAGWVRAASSPRCRASHGSYAP